MTSMAKKRNKNDPHIREAIETMLKAGQSQRTIAASLRMRRATVATILRQIRESELMQKPPNSKAGVTSEPSGNHGSESQSDKSTRVSRKPAKEITEVRTVSRYVQKGSEYLSDMLLSDLKLSMESAKAIRELELRYRVSAEKYGVNWVTFLNEAIEWGFQSIVEADAMLQEWR
ncbi:MAG: hypothetical protein RE469_04020 [Cuniculiplasma divulgatum]|nr:MAG: hypothetical protein RE469_04020 [Cuniculiplasma divulgatum]